MEEHTTQNGLTVAQVLALVTKLGKIPYTLETEATVGLPIRECVMLLEKLKEAITKPSVLLETQEE